MSTITSVKGRTFTVSRAKWLRGEGGPESYLLRLKDGLMCCLGQIGQQCGYADEQLQGQGLPIVIGWGELNHLGESQECYDVRRMMATNDDDTITDDIREPRLQQLATKLGFSLVFVP